MAMPSLEERLATLEAAAKRDVDALGWQASTLNDIAEILIDALRHDLPIDTDIVQRVDLVRIQTMSRIARITVAWAAQERGTALDRERGDDEPSIH